MSWILLVLAGLLEACWAVGLKFTDGFSKPLPSLIVGAAIVGSIILLAMAMRDLPVATAYAVWVSIGIIGAAIAQPLVFNEPLKFSQVFFLGLLMLSVKMGRKETDTKKREKIQKPQALRSGKGHSALSCITSILQFLLVARVLLPPDILLLGAVRQFSC